MADFVTSFQHVAILVSDVEASKRWYEDLLGWKQMLDHEMPPALGDANGFHGRTGRIALGTIAGVGVEFVQMDTELEAWERNEHYGLFLISVRVDSLEHARERCVELCVTIDREVTIGAARCIVVSDPDGQEVFLVASAAPAPS